MRAADALAVAAAVALPWSTSATSILLAIWLIALVPTLSWAELRGALTTPAGGLPVLLFALGVLGMAPNSPRVSRITSARLRWPSHQ